MSEWTKAKGDEACYETMLGKEFWLCFSKWHDSQDKLDNLDKIGTSCCILKKLGWPGWAWRRDGEYMTVPTCADILRW